MNTKVLINLGKNIKKYRLEAELVSKKKFNIKFCGIYGGFRQMLMKQLQNGTCLSVASCAVMG